jgi:hypothetical protein
MITSSAMEPKRIIHGVAGLAKVGAQLAGAAVDQAPADVIAKRRHACSECPHATKHPPRGLTIHSLCTRCGCLISAKVRLASEACPDLPPRW